MTLVGIRIISSIQHLEAKIHPLLLCMTNDFLVACDTVLRSILEGDVLGLAGKGNDVGTTEIGGGIDRLASRLDNHLMILRVDKALDERWSIDGNGRNGAG